MNGEVEDVECSRGIEKCLMTGVVVRLAEGDYNGVVVMV